MHLVYFDWVDICAAFETFGRGGADFFDFLFGSFFYCFGHVDRTVRGVNECEICCCLDGGLEGNVEMFWTT